LRGALLGDASGDADSNAQSSAKLIRVHPHLSLASATLNWFLKIVPLSVADVARRK
jgi:hypothetical protein